MSVFVVFGAIAPILTAQNIGVSDTTATPVAGVPHDYLGDLSEIVNPANGSLSIRIKAPVPRERGVNWPAYAFMWDSSNIYSLSPSWTNGVDGNTSFSSLNLIAGPPLSYFGLSVTQSLTLPSGGGDAPTTTTYTCDISSQYTFLDPDGGNHAMGLQYNLSTDSTQANYNCGEFNLGQQWTTGGDELYKARMNTAAWPPSVTVYDNHGDALLTSNSSQGPVSLTSQAFNIAYAREDTNGNYLNTTGRTWSSGLPSGFILSTGTFSMTFPGSSSSWSLTNTAAAANAVNFTIPVSNVGSTSGGNYCQVSSVTTASSIWITIAPLSGSAITLPDGLQYSIDYSQNPYGLVDQITYPTGATVNYTWEMIPNMEGVLYTNKFGSGSGGICALTYGWYAITKRVVTYNGREVQEQDFQYNTTWPATGNTQNSYIWTSKTTTVTTKDLIRGTSFNTVYTYSPMAPPQTSDYAGVWGDPSPLPVESTIKYQDTTGATLKTVTKTWQSPSLMSGECETLPNGSTSGKFFQYEAGGLGGINPNASMTNLPTDVKEYDYGQVSGSGSGCVAPSTSVKPIRETVTAYSAFSCPSSLPYCPAAQMLDRPSSVKIYGNGIQVSETDYQYDQWALVPVSNAYGQDPNYEPTAGYSATSNTNFTPASGSTLLPRGNPTTVTRKCFVGSTSCMNSITEYQYDTTGQVVAVMEPCGASTCSDITGGSHVTSYSYTDHYAGDGTAPSGYTTNAYVTTVTKPATTTTHISTYTYGFKDGRLWSATDENSNLSTFYYATGGKTGTSYDPFYRLTEADHPDGGKETLGYTDAGPNPTVTESTLENSSATWVTKETVYDEMGHAIQSQVTTDPAGTVYAETTYDGLGNVITQTNPHRTAAAKTDGTTTYYIDALGRNIETVEQDGSVKQTCYDGVVSSPAVSNCSASPLGTATTGTWVDTSDEVGNHWQHVSDALGRLKRVMEPNSTSQSPSMETDYSYDALGNLLTVTQNGVTGTDVARSRSFTYDSLSRLLTSHNPEIGTTSVPAITYTYDTNGNLSTKVSPAVNVPATGAASTTTIGYCYDNLNRLKYKFYTSSFSCQSPSGFASAYAYDGTKLSGSTVSTTTFSNANGHVTDEQQFTGATMVAERVLPTYDAMGRLNTDIQVPFALSPTNYTMTAAFDYMGHITQFNNGTSSASSPSVPAISWNASYNAAAELNSLTVNSQPSTWTGTAYPTSLLYSPTYDPFGHLVTAQMSSTSTSGTGQIQVSRSYDNRGRINSEIDTGAAQTSSATSALGTIVILGSEQGPVYPANSYARATVTVSGTEADNTFNACPNNPQGSCPTAIPDTGVVSITVAGTTESTTFALGSTSASLALTLATDINNAGLPVTATVSGSVVTITSTTPGTSSNGITLSATSSDTQTQYYSSPSFTLSASGSALANGTNATKTQYDSGTISATVNSHTATVSFNSTSTPQSIAIALSAAVQSAVGSSITVSTDGDVSVLIATTTGTASDYAISTAYTYDTTDFSSPSFQASSLGMQDGFTADSSQGNLYTYFVPNGGYAPNGNILFTSDSVNGDWEYTYDTLNRLSTGTALAGTFKGQYGCWTYDSFGNRKLEAYSTATATPCATGANDNVFSTSTPQSTANNNQLSTSAYDQAGNVINDGLNQYVYDPEGRVCAIVNATTGAYQYVYDAEGRRVAKGQFKTGTTPPSGGATCAAPTSALITPTALYLLDQDGNQITELNGTGVWQHSNTWSGARIEATYASSLSGVWFHFTDPLGTRRVMADWTGKSQQTCQSLPFGSRETCTESPTEQLFTGKERDQESGLDYFGARYYGSSMGRWMSPDLVNVTEERMMNPSSTLNKYAYGADNPLKYIDPDGQDITVFYESGVPGHIMMMAYDPSMSSAATRSFGPASNYARGTWGSVATILGLPVPATTQFDFDQLKSADDIRAHYASITIKTSPEVTQQVIQAIVSHSGDKKYTTLGYACASSCARILRQIQQFSKQCCSGALIPNTFFTDLYQQYGNGTAPRDALGSPVFHPGNSYGAYQPGWNEFDVLNMLIKSQQQRPTRNCTINVNADGSESGDC